jgi:hypothetical protein
VLAARAGGAGTARSTAASDFVSDLLMVMRERSAQCLFVRIPQRGARPPVAQDYFAIRKIPESLPSRYIVTRYIMKPRLACIFRTLHPYFWETVPTRGDCAYFGHGLVRTPRRITGPCKEISYYDMMFRGWRSPVAVTKEIRYAPIRSVAISRSGAHHGFRYRAFGCSPYVAGGRRKRRDRSHLIALV